MNERSMYDVNAFYYAKFFGEAELVVNIYFQIDLVD